MKTILGIDPGTFESGFVLVKTKEDGSVILIGSGVIPNQKAIDIIIGANPADELVIEMINSQGMAVGIETFETCVWIGRFVQAWSERHTNMALRVFRRDVKDSLCGSQKAKDSNIRQALIDRFGEQGTKKNPGPMYGMKSHTWPALAVVVAAMDRKMI